MPGVSTGGGSNAFDARINGGLQSGDEATRRRRQHAAGLHEPGRHGVDLPGLPDVARHGQRGEGPDVELRAGIRLVDVGPDHGGDAVGWQLVPRRRLHLSPRRLAQGDAVGRVDASRSSTATTTAPTSAARRRCPACGATRSRASSSSTTRATGRPAARTRRRCRFPRCRERNGDFTDWRDSSGNLIPIYDPATHPARRQRRLHQGSVHGVRRPPPNVICPSRINPIVRAWLEALPNPTSDGPLNNYLGAGRSPTRFSATPTTTWGATTCRSPTATTCSPASGTSARRPSSSRCCRSRSPPRPTPIRRTRGSTGSTGTAPSAPTLLNHMSMGYLNRNEGYGSVNQDFVDDFPQIAGVAGHHGAAADLVRRRLRPVRQQRRHQRRQHHDAADLHHQRHGDVDDAARTR